MKKTLFAITATVSSLVATAQTRNGSGEIPHIAPNAKAVKIALLTDTHVFHKGEDTDVATARNCRD